MREAQFFGSQDDSMKDDKLPSNESGRRFA